MKRQMKVGPLGRALRPGEDEVDQSAPARLGKPFLALAGAAVVLLGCQIDPGETAPGGLEPSASMQRSERDDASPSGGPSDADGQPGDGESSGGAEHGAGGTGGSGAGSSGGGGADGGGSGGGGGGSS